MGRYIKAKNDIYNYLCARIPLIIVNTSERERVERIFYEIRESFPMSDILYYTDARQVCSFKNSPEQNVENDPLPFISNYFKKHRSTIFVIGDVKRVGEDNSYSREVLNILYVAKENNNTLVLVTADRVWQRLAQFGMIVKLEYPDIEERTVQIQNFISTYEKRYPIDWTEEDIMKAATLLRGFSEIQIENILSSAIITSKGLYRAEIAGLTGQKGKLYAPIPAIQFINFDNKPEVSGLECLKQWLHEKKGIFFAPDEALSSRGLTTPKGILLAGVPGCGKSLSARMISKEWELPLFRFDIGNVYDKWVGESEKKMAEALSFIDNVAPCVVWIDEIEKALAISDNGNDTGKRVLGQFLFWLQESDSRVFLVATANDVTLLPTELFRKGRFSEVFFIDLPNVEERISAIRQYCAQALHIELSDVEMRELADMSKGFSYSDIENAIKDEAQKAVVHGQSIITFNNLKNTFASVVPISKSNPEAIEKIREWGKNRAYPASNILEEENK